MTFTDEDLTRLKDKAERSNTYTNMDCDKVLALLARLEAAERWALFMCNADQYDLRNLEQIERLARAWRKVAGK